MKIKNVLASLVLVTMVIGGITLISNPAEAKSAEAKGSAKDWVRCLQFVNNINGSQCIIPAAVVSHCLKKAASSKNVTVKSCIKRKIRVCKKIGNNPGRIFGGSVSACKGL